MKEVELTPDARLELRGAIAYYQARDHRVATDFFIEIGNMLERIAENPAQFPVWEDDPAFRKAVLPVTFPYILFFHEMGDSLVEIVAISHGALEPGYWLARRC